MIYKFGANELPSIRNAELQRFILPGVIENDVYHLLWNCFVLLVVGCNAEYYLGTAGYGMLILSSILLGNFFTAAFREKSCYMSVGAATAIEGIMAFEVIWFLFNIGNMGLSVLLYIIYYGTIFLTTAFGIFTPGYVVDYWGHLGGFIAGICITALFYQAIAKNSILRLFGFLLAFVLIGLFIATGFVIFSRKDINCHQAWCHNKVAKS